MDAFTSPEIVLFTGVRLKVGRVHAKALRERFRARPRAAA